MASGNFVVSSSRPGLPSVVVTDANAGKTFMVSDVGAETDVNTSGSGNVTGVSGTGGVGSVSPSISDTLTGVSGTGGVGTTTSKIEYTLTGLASTTAIGTPLANANLDVAVTGLAATAAIGTPVGEIGFTLDGLEATSELGSEAWEIDLPISGLAAAAAIGTPLAEGSSEFTLPGQFATTAIGLPLAIVTPNITNVTPTGQQATTGLGTIAKTHSVTLPGQAAVAGLGAPQAVHYQGGLRLGDLECAEPKNADDIFVGLRWSDSYGEAWNFPLHQSKGSEGQYLTNLQFRRLGLARNRVFEVSWSSPTPTALQGVTLQFEEAGT
jgi:hypothetical protein